MIEIDGKEHSKKENKEYDKIRTDYFAGLDINVLRFTNAEINTNIENVVDGIVNKLI